MRAVFFLHKIFRASYSPRYCNDQAKSLWFRFKNCEIKKTYKPVACSKVVRAIPRYGVQVRIVFMLRVIVGTIEIIIEHFKVGDWIAQLIFQIVGWSFKAVSASEQSSLLGVFLHRKGHYYRVKLNAAVELFLYSL